MHASDGARPIKRIQAGVLSLRIALELCKKEIALNLQDGLILAQSLVRLNEFFNLKAPS